MAYHLCSCILRAVGDSKTPFLAIVISSALNILLDSLLIFVLKTGAEGAAIATVFSQAVSTLICILRVRQAASDLLQMISKAACACRLPSSKMAFPWHV